MVSIKNKIIALGFFDSLHIGHRFLLNEGKKIADSLSTVLIPATFDDGFYDYFGMGSKEIYTLSERIGIFNTLGYEKIVVFPVNPDFLSKSKSEFLEYILGLSPVGIVAGSDYTFGKNGEGNLEFMKNYFKDKIQVYEISLLRREERKVSSSDIRQMIIRGDFRAANSLLGNEFSISGTVIKGRGVGHRIGIPTANLETDEHKLLPDSGVFYTLAEIDGKRYKSVTNIGAKPTFGISSKTVEALILDYEGNLYGKQITLSFRSKIRDILKFSTTMELVLQINRDIESIKTGEE